MVNYVGEVFYRFWTINPEDEVDVEAVDAHLKRLVFHLKLYFERVEKPEPSKPKRARRVSKGKG